MKNSFFCIVLLFFINNIPGCQPLPNTQFLDIVMRKKICRYDKVFKYEFVFIDFLLNLIRSKGQLLRGGEGTTHGDGFSITSS
jgi:hypothetical protein